MIRLRALAPAATVLALAACGATTPPAPLHTGLRAADVVRELPAHGVNATLGAIYQEEGISGASFQSDEIAVTGPGGGPGDFVTGGLIQVFADENAAAEHAKGIATAASQPPEHTYRVGNVLLRISKGLPEVDARRYRTAVEEILRQD
ncbi:hypothetical protein [Herbidospora daliensis]|uniref:hypothetical protein n=1 Tax=Herbidospora daliensis TaxID=295585 RepID=UPI0007835CF7|nr:hypothetical protein [Herbidospora daliensis]